MSEYISFVDKTGDEDFEFRHESEEHLLVGPTALVNILVGANNSRKSRFMRMLWASDDNPTVRKDVLDAFHKGLKNLDIIIGLTVGAELINAQLPAANIPDRHVWFDEVFDDYKHGDMDYKHVLFSSTLSQNDTPDGVRFVLDEATLLSIKQRFMELFTKVASKHQVGITDYAAFSDLFELLHKNAKKHNETIIGNTDKFNFKLMSEMGDNFLTIHESFEVLLTEKTIAEGIPKIFIPALRGALPIEGIDSGRAQYRDSTYKLYFGEKDKNGKVSSWGTSPDKSIHAGDELYSQILTDRNSNIERREKFQQFQTFVSEHFFDGNRVEVVAKPGDDDQTIMVYIDGEKERNLQDVGDGIQHLLIILYPIFMAEDNTWIFIDEPELSLHPGFQNLLLDTLLNNEDLKKKNLRYFMTTHSNHFLSHALRKPDDVSVFSFSQHDAKQSTIRCVHGADTTVLDQLGVENASVYMANCSIWVEGVSDRKYIQAFLKSYCKATGKREFKEGLDYAFFEYAGSNVRHYLFDQDIVDTMLIDSFKIANRIFLLADQDMSGEKQNRHKELEALNGENFKYCTTIVREIENILPPTVYQDFIQSHKTQEGVSFTEDLDKYAQNPMGKFLREHTGDKPLAYGEGTLTTGHKNELSQLTIDKEYDWKILSTSKELVRITETVYSFIEKHNSPN